MSEALGQEAGGQAPEGPGPTAGWGAQVGPRYTGVQPDNQGPPPGPRVGMSPPAHEACRASPQSKQHPKSLCLRCLYVSMSQTHEGPCGDRGPADQTSNQGFVQDWCDQCLGVGVVVRGSQLRVK